MIQFNASKEDFKLIREIAKRASERYPDSYQDILMDIEACHCNGCPLRLRELLAAQNFDFFHDVFGINKHLNRETGALENCFLPRYAKLEVNNLETKHVDTQEGQ